MPKGIKVLKAGTYGFYDVFTGMGWDGHTRVRWNTKVGHLQFVTGRHLSKGVVQEVLSFIQGKPQEQHEAHQVTPEVKPHLYVVK